MKRHNEDPNLFNPPQSPVANATNRVAQGLQANENSGSWASSNSVTDVSLRLIDKPYKVPSTRSAPEVLVSDQQTFMDLLNTIVLFGDEDDSDY